MGLSEEKGVPCKWFEPLIMTKTINSDLQSLFRIDLILRF
jgi:hypothetical protein